MEDEIQEKLNEIYNFKIKVEFLDFRKYKFIGEIDNKKKIEFIILYDVTSTIEANIHIISNKIDLELARLYKKGGE